MKRLLILFLGAIVLALGTVQAQDQPESFGIAYLTTETQHSVPAGLVGFTKNVKTFFTVAGVPKFQFSFKGHGLYFDDYYQGSYDPEVIAASPLICAKLFKGPVTVAGYTGGSWEFAAGANDWKWAAGAEIGYIIDPDYLSLNVSATCYPRNEGLPDYWLFGVTVGTNSTKALEAFTEWLTE